MFFVCTINKKPKKNNVRKQTAVLYKELELQSLKKLPCVYLRMEKPHLSSTKGFAEGACRVTHKLQEDDDGRGGGRGEKGELKRDSR